MLVADETTKGNKQLAIGKKNSNRQWAKSKNKKQLEKLT
jgi:hypothetical protein